VSRVGGRDSECVTTARDRDCSRVCRRTGLVSPGNKTFQQLLNVLPTLFAQRYPVIVLPRGPTLHGSRLWTRVSCHFEPRCRIIQQDVNRHSSASRSPPCLAGPTATPNVDLCIDITPNRRGMKWEGLPRRSCIEQRLPMKYRTCPPKHDFFLVTRPLTPSDTVVWVFQSPTVPSVWSKNGWRWSSCFPSSRGD
jgi:hypothetical protein